jgi:hypothetical protein
VYVEYGSSSGSSSGSGLTGDFVEYGSSSSSSSGSGLTGDFVEYGSGFGSSLTRDFFKAQAILDCLTMAMVILVIA